MEPIQELNGAAHHGLLPAVDRVINKLLHGPLQSLRDAPHEDHRESLATAIRRLFKLG
jgi:glutamyl-tRNA reductase